MCCLRPEFVCFLCCCFLFVVQAIGDPGQGWANTILFVFLSPAVRQRLLKCCCKSRRFRNICRRHSSSSSPSVDYEPYRSTSPIEQCVHHPRVLGLSGTNSEMSSPVAVPRRNSRRSSFAGSIDTSDYGVQFPSSPSYWPNISSNPVAFFCFFFVEFYVLKNLRVTRTPSSSQDFMFRDVYPLFDVVLFWIIVWFNDKCGTP